MVQPGQLPGGDLGSREEQSNLSTTQHLPKPSDAVEMDNLSPDAKAPEAASAAADPASANNAMSSTRDAESSQTPLHENAGPLNTTTDSGNPAHPSAKALGKAPATHADSPDQDAIGPADSSQEPSVPGELTVDILIIIPTTGNRHPFRINEKYLTKRNVNVTGVTEDGKMDPFSITVYTLKELVLREWRKEWETPPREPTSIRLIKMGKMLDDKATLSQYDFSPSVTSIIHMTVKPQEIVDEEEANKRLKEPGSQSGRSGCCVIL
ncbi:hypothetical protein BKA67DRAFT_530857 [Truncatella angustata]|uniref:Ubiquitin-like domain-containing protein n=1 Tax=Truncatella angustata TaxID=152316 RepID=A0A9P9A4Z6_9PEZI|nr:uncharacterized protein BKA67DRAFT_530857 [Truncatella angustata]KAH6660770.1 hypothetical protein BKA67DRAFT_530857 [Truncatella angustata]KAH8203014.1 hypothetical protein TruAng_002848 [Truncatella angustata]